MEKLEPIPVVIHNVDELKAQPVREIEPEHFICSTYVLSSSGLPTGQASVQILALDNKRKSALIISADQPIVLCHSAAQINQAQNQVTNVPNPDGAYLAAGVGVDIDGGGPLWAVATVATATRVSVIINKRS